MLSSSFQEIKQVAIKKLKTGLSPKLTYHHVNHTLDVLEQVESIAALENIQSEEDLFLLKVSALYHDIGFLDTYAGHEERSCEIAMQDLSALHLTTTQLETICDLIRVTLVPQKPKTILQQIMCDADLDYLGRDDFFVIGEGLYQEFLWQGVIKNELEWNRLQVKFLESHRYFTKSSISRREKQKRRHLAQVKAKLTQLP